MANNPFDRTPWYPLERPLADDLNQGPSQDDRALRYVLERLYARRTSAADPTALITAGFLADGLRVVAGGGMSVNLTPGLGFLDNTAGIATAIGGVVGLDDRTAFAPALLSAVQAIAIDPAPGADLARKDAIFVKVDRRLENNTSRDLLDVASGTFVPTLKLKTLSYDLLGRNSRVDCSGGNVVGTTGIVYKVGPTFAYVDPGTGSVPDCFLTTYNADPVTDSGYVKIATINVATGTAAIVENLIADWRPMLYHDALIRISGGTTLGARPMSTCTIAGLPAGMRAAVLRDAASNLQTFTAYLFHGPVTSLGHANGSASSIVSVWGKPVAVGTNIYSPDYGGGAGGLVNTALQTALASALPVVQAAIGQPYTYPSFTVVRYAITGGPTFTLASTYADPLDLELAIAIRRNG